jgi:hypothetical protein
MLASTRAVRHLLAAGLGRKSGARRSEAHRYDTPHGETAFTMSISANP